MMSTQSHALGETIFLNAITSWKGSPQTVTNFFALFVTETATLANGPVGIVGAVCNLADSRVFLVANSDKRNLCFAYESVAMKTGAAWTSVNPCFNRILTASVISFVRIGCMCSHVSAIIGTTGSNKLPSVPHTARVFYACVHRHI